MLSQSTAEDDEPTKASVAAPSIEAKVKPAPALDKKEKIAAAIAKAKAKKKLKEEQNDSSKKVPTKQPDEST